jgi:hypothetical protein
MRGDERYRARWERYLEEKVFKEFVAQGIASSRDTEVINHC